MPVTGARSLLDAPSWSSPCEADGQGHCTARREKYFQWEREVLGGGKDGER